MRRLIRNLARLASEERYLFTPDDLRALVPDISDGAYKTLLSRAASEGHLVRVCRGLYLFEPASPSNGLLLFHAAARLRAAQFNYISLETALSCRGYLTDPDQLDHSDVVWSQQHDFMRSLGHYRVRSYQTATPGSRRSS
nr:type IV toxin-antitoxin system AbiEi family antitoxin domain-containing protein [uncultured Pseudomonas sp.]